MTIATESLIENLLTEIKPSVSQALNTVLSGNDLSYQHILDLLCVSNKDLIAVLLSADYLRYKVNGDKVSYVVNRNINFTNVCIKRCGFCAFSRDFRHEQQSYFLPIDEVVRRAKQAWDLGATEVCIQAGLPPKMDGDLYVNITEAIKRDIPDIHIHGFSPEEILYGSQRSKSTIKEYLIRLKDAGVGSLPGTSAEILEQDVRNKIAPGRITKNQWIDVIRTAHDIGIKTSATMMYGHVETNENIASHILEIRNIQKTTHGFTEFVPLSFVHEEAPMNTSGIFSNINLGPSALKVMLVHAVSRLSLINHINNIQVSWVKEGHMMSQILLSCGVNDMGGTLINESISTSAGAKHGQLTSPKVLKSLITEVNKFPVERNSIYKEIDSTGRNYPLDVVENPDKEFGSYFELVNSKSFRYKHPNK
ncbi:MAG: 7,8-didemethyl-8-hydroxy-5-deazariboflavin synthase subunit CofH [Chloroflexi bacterium]|nr:7,8-didemethyl-8-hydroxy-5-deazariboflavin synthase subunit CofH [Chloroflexota bacterium]